MLECFLKYFFKIFSLIWDNISDIDSTLSTIGIAISAVGCIVIRLKNKHNRLICFNLDKQTRQSLKYYVSVRGSDVDPCEQVNIANNSGFELIPFFMKAFKNSESQYFIILADSGMGKTTFLLKLFFKYKRKIFKKYKIILIPLPSSQAFEEIRKIKNKPRTILLLDGFDDDGEALKNCAGRLKEICDETELFFKVVITCRTQFFSDKESEPQITGKIRFGVGKKNIEFKKYYILPFFEFEIISYLKKKYNPFFKKEKYEQALNLIFRCYQLVMRPMLLSYIDDLLQDNEKEYYNVYEMYEILVNKWIEREALNNNNLLYEFSDKLAEYMYVRNKIYIKPNEITNLCKKYDIKLQSLEATSRSLLNRNANGDYKFAHKSILEFFLAKNASNNFQFRKIIAKNGYEGYEMLKLFLKEMDQEYIYKLIRDELRGLNDISFEYFQLSDIKLYGMSIIDCNFTGCNLQRAELAGARLTYANLRQADLMNANLLGANLREANLEQAKLSGAKLKLTYLQSADFSNADLSKADLRRAYMRDANLIGANLEKADLSGADLRQANLLLSKLIGANFTNTNLEGVLLDENQVNCLRKECDLKDTWVYVFNTKKIMNYQSYCEENKL